jgi:hypothetical protein
LAETPPARDSRGNPPKVTAEALLNVALVIKLSPASTTPLELLSFQSLAVTIPVGSPDPAKVNTR